MNFIDYVCLIGISLMLAPFILRKLRWLNQLGDGTLTSELNKQAETFKQNLEKINLKNEEFRQKVNEISARILNKPFFVQYVVLKKEEKELETKKRNVLDHIQRIENLKKEVY